MASLSVVFLPETSNRNLPETIKDIQKLKFTLFHKEDKNSKATSTTTTKEEAEWDDLIGKAKS
jgi:hypothetical protein